MVHKKHTALDKAVKKPYQWQAYDYEHAGIMGFHVKALYHARLAHHGLLNIAKPDCNINNLICIIYSIGDIPR